MQISKKTQKTAKKPNFCQLIPLNTQIKIFFSKFRPCHFFYFIDPQLHAKFLKNLMSSLPRYLKTDRPTDVLTKKGDYYGPHRVNPGTKINRVFQSNTYNFCFRLKMVHPTYYFPSPQFSKPPSFFHKSSTPRPTPLLSR